MSDEDSGSALDDEDEEPILVSGTAGTKQTMHTGNGSATPVYGYRDVFGKESAKRRLQLIELKVGPGD